MSAAISVASFRDDEQDNLDFPKSRKDPPSIFEYSIHSEPSNFSLIPVSEPGSPSKNSVRFEDVEKEINALSKTLDPQPEPKPITNKFKTASERLNHLVKENLELSEQALSKEKELKKLSSETQEQKQEFEQNQHKLLEAKEKLHTIQNELELQLEEKQDLRIEIHRKAADMLRLQQELEQIVDSDLRQKAETKSLKLTVYELKAALQEVTEKYSLHVKEAEIALKREDELLKKYREKENLLHESVKIQEELEHSLDKKEADINGLLKLVQDLKKRIDDLEKQELKSYENSLKNTEKLKESEHKTEKLAIALQNYEKEVKFLKQELNSFDLANKTKIEKELQDMQILFDSDKSRLLSEINSLEQSKCQSIQMMDRAIHEKRMAENELAKQIKQHSVESEHFSLQLEELNKRIIISDRLKSEAERRLERLSQECHSLQNQNHSQTRQHAVATEELFKRVKRSESLLEQSREENIALHCKFQESEDKNRKLEEKMQQMELDFKNERKHLTGKFELESRHLNQQLSSLSVNLESTSKELLKTKADLQIQQRSEQENHQLLLLQQKKTVDYLSSQITKLKDGEQELLNEINALKKSKFQLEQQLNQSRQNFSDLNNNLVNSESRMEKLLLKLQNMQDEQLGYSKENHRLEKLVHRYKKQQPVEAEQLQKDLERVKSRLLDGDDF